MNSFGRFFAAAAVFTLLFSPGSARAGDRLYRIPFGDWGIIEEWIVDRDGNEVSPDYTETDLVDLATDEARYKVRTRRIISRDEDGYAALSYSSSLLDLAGNTLIDWKTGEYNFAFGECIIRRINYHSVLCHVPTGRESYEGALYAEKLDGGKFLLAGFEQTPLGVVNESGETLPGFPISELYDAAYVRGKYIVATSYEQGASYLLDSDFNELFAADWIGRPAEMPGDYLSYERGDEKGVFHPEEGIVFSVSGASVPYYDGELAIVREGYGGDVKATLVNHEGAEIAGGFSWLAPDTDDFSGGTAGVFIGVADERAVFVDREGNIIASSEKLPNARTLNKLYEGLYAYSSETYPGQSGLLGSDLELRTPAGLYSDIYTAYGMSRDEIKSAEDILLQARRGFGPPDGYGFPAITRVDILDHTGRVIVGNVTSVSEVGPDRIVLQRGFDAGLMDWNGNWVVKRRIFSNLLED